MFLHHGLLIFNIFTPQTKPWLVSKYPSRRSFWPKLTLKFTKKPRDNALHWYTVKPWKMEGCVAQDPCQRTYLLSEVNQDQTLQERIVTHLPPISHVFIKPCLPIIPHRFVFILKMTFYVWLTGIIRFSKQNAPIPTSIDINSGMIGLPMMTPLNFDMALLAQLQVCTLFLSCVNIVGSLVKPGYCVSFVQSTDMSRAGGGSVNGSLLHGLDSLGEHTLMGYIEHNLWLQ